MNLTKNSKPVKVPVEKQESLKVTLKLTSQAGSDKRAFEVRFIEGVLLSNFDFC